MTISSLFRSFREHPLTDAMGFDAIGRFVRWQFGSRLLGQAVVVPLVNDTRLIVQTGMTGATGNIYVGLQEFHDMSFLLHYLRPGDKFGDVGANVGVYTVLAAGVCGAQTISIEPIAATAERLLDNIQLNRISDLVNVRQCGVGSETGNLFFSSNLDTMNRVVQEGEEVEIVEVPVDTLDNIFTNTPTLIKIDVEGFEHEALSGASRILADHRLGALIVEINGNNDRYGTSKSSLHSLICGFGFSPFGYDPKSRTIFDISSLGEKNTIYIRDISSAMDRVKNAPRFTVKNGRATL